MSSTHLRIQDLHTHFHTQYGRIHAVNGVTLHVTPGETLGIVGESGSGKSVTMLSVMRLLPSTGRIKQGEIWLHDQELSQLPPSAMRRIRGRQIAMIFQDPMTSLNPVLTIGRQISEALQLHLKRPAAQAQEETIDWLAQVGIPAPTQRIHQYPHQLSGGMRQRVMIAMALSCHPQVLIADEPTTALDVTIQAQIVALVKQLRTALGMAVIWITHDLALLAGIADRILVMYAGQIVESATVGALYRNPRHPYTQGLMQSIPRLGRTPNRLRAIEGQPPNLLAYPVGCPFAARCQWVTDPCRESNPPLEFISPDHAVACWVKPESRD